ncbi:tail fiber/spike domain-containing protein [Enterobacter soli]|uniref:tail fiber/spike domain-containing protein n=1 Tax=Enterobacter soli TaxID=885040 RepID=UPI003733954D
MTTTPTQNSVPSESPIDLKFNAGKIDEFVTSLVHQYIDRFGIQHYTIEGLRWLAQQAIAQYGWIPYGTFQAGATLTLPNQILKDTTDGEYYRWDGSFLPSGKIVSAGSTPASSGGVGIGAWISVGDSALRSMLASSAGAGMVGLNQGGKVQNALTSIYLDGWPGVDPTGNTDSTAGILAAIESILGAGYNSCYIIGTQKFAKFKFGRGIYMFGDIVLPSGCVFDGENEWVTRYKQKPGSSFLFKTEGTQDYATGGITKRYVGGGIRNASIGAGYVEGLDPIPAGVGGIKVQYASWFQMEHVTLKHIDGTGLHLDEVWDVDIMTTQIQACGLGYTSSNNVVGLHLGPGTSVNDGCNAIRFTGFHLEACPKLFEMLDRTRHVSLAEAKLEATPTGVSSVIQGVNEVSFPNAELTWQRSDYPMIYAVNGNSDGVSFNGARLISSSATPGWYFQYNSANGPLKLNNIHARAVKKIVEGSNIQMVGASSWFSGPCLVNAFQKAQIHSCDFRANRPSTATDGTEDAIVFTGTDCEAVNNTIECGGSNSDGAAAINVTSGATNAKVMDNTLAGAKQYGIRQNAAVTSKWIRDNRLSATANYGSLILGPVALYTIVSPNSAGIGLGGVNGTPTPIAIAVNASVAGLPAAGCTLLLLRFSYGGSTASALVLVDASTNGIVILGQTSTSGGNVLQTGTGAAGDGSIRISKSGAAVTFTNFTVAAATLTATSLSAVA